MSDRQFFHDRLSTAASSVAFYILLGGVPGLAAVVSLYGLFADPHDVTALSGTIGDIVPADLANLLSQQVSRLAGQNSGAGKGPSLDYLVWPALFLWSANRGIKGFSDALNIIYNRVEQRPWLLRLGVTLLMTVGAIGFLVVALATVLLLPAVLTTLPAENSIAMMIGWLRWPAMLLLTALAIMILLRFGPSRKEAHWPSILCGSLMGHALDLGAGGIFLVRAKRRELFCAVWLARLGHRVHDLAVAVGAGGSGRRRIRRRRNLRPIRTSPRRRAVPLRGRPRRSRSR